MEVRLSQAIEQDDEFSFMAFSDPPWYATRHKDPSLFYIHS